MSTIRLNKEKRAAILKNIMDDWKTKHPKPVAPKMSAARAAIMAYQAKWFKRSGIEKALQAGLTPTALNQSTSLHLYVKNRETGKNITNIWEYFRDDENRSVQTYVPNDTVVIYNDDPIYKTYLDDKSAYERYDLELTKWGEERRAQSKVYESALEQFKTVKQLTDGWDGIEKYLPTEFEQKSTAVAVIPQLP